MENTKEKSLEKRVEKLETKVSQIESKNEKLKQIIFKIINDLII